MEKYHYRESGLDNVWLVGGFRIEHDEEYGELLFIEDVPALHGAIARALLDKKSPLTGAEFRFLRKFCELSQGDTAGVIQSNEQSVAKWEKARDKPVGNRPAEVLFRIFAARVVGGDDLLLSFIRTLNEIRAGIAGQSDICMTHDNDNDWHFERMAA
jgi:DNA-binding transcriptional regulator YiaG